MAPFLSICIFCVEECLFSLMEVCNMLQKLERFWWRLCLLLNLLPNVQQQVLLMGAS